MVCNNDYQYYFLRWSSSCVSTKHGVSGTGSVSTIKYKRKDSTQLGPLEIAGIIDLRIENLSCFSWQQKTDPVSAILCFEGTQDDGQREKQ